MQALATDPAAGTAALSAAARGVCAFVALQHVGFLVLEMFLWKHPVGRKIFRTKPEFAAESAALAANQGLYNGFLAAGLAWAAATARPDLALFFLGCVAAAGLFGAATVSWRILAIQAVPALVGLALAAPALSSPLRHG